MKKIVIMIILFITAFDVNAGVKTCTPSEEYLKYLELSEEEKLNVIPPKYCNEINNIDNYKMNYSNKSITYNEYLPKLNSVSNISYYNSLDEGYVSNVKNQYQTGYCWAFSNISNVEINAKKKGIGDFNFSTAHFAYSISKDLYVDSNDLQKYINIIDGGPVHYGTTYFYDKYGQVMESEWKYANFINNSGNNLKKINTSEYILGQEYVSVDDFSYRFGTGNGPGCSVDSIDYIKEKVYTEGSVISQIFMDEKKILNNNYFLIDDINQTVNHSIIIIGWDDDISKDNFNGATRDGAFIVLNSWGSNWSDDGIFYVSYDDEYICNIIANYSVSSPKNYKKVYKSSEVVGDLNILVYDTSYVMAKFFKDDIEESIDRISFAVPSNAKYNIYLDRTSSTNPENWEKIATGVSQYIGMKSVDLENIKVSGDYAIIIEFDIDSLVSSSFFTTCNNGPYGPQEMNIVPNVNYSSDDGVNWLDMASWEFGYTYACQPNIFVYTDLIPITSGTGEEESNSLTDINLEVADYIINLNMSTNDYDVAHLLYKIYDTNNNDISNHFYINVDNNNIYIVSDNSISGDLRLEIDYEGDLVFKNFKLEEGINIIDNSLMKFYNGYLILNSIPNRNWNVIDLKNNISFVNTILTISLIKTGGLLSTNNRSFEIVLMGDSNGDGVINSGDLLKIVKYLKGTSSLIGASFISSDTNSDDVINSGDLLKIVKYLKGSSVLNGGK